MLDEFQMIELKFEKDLLKTQLEIQEQTLKNISQEIHDNISLSLTLAKLHLNTINMDAMTEKRDLIDSSIDLISKSLSDLNDLSKSLDGQVIEKYGLLHALEQETENMKKTGRLKIKLEIYGEPVYLDHQRELMIFRIVQESFNNILKHAEASSIDLELEYSEKDLSISITDDGNGFDVEKARTSKNGKLSSGLKNMSNRAQLIQSHIDIVSIPGTGTKIILSTPYNTKNGI
jgi:signal transduction histidine kinase